MPDPLSNPNPSCRDCGATLVRKGRMGPWPTYCPNCRVRRQRGPAVRHRAMVDGRLDRQCEICGRRPSPDRPGNWSRRCSQECREVAYLVDVAERRRIRGDG